MTSELRLIDPFLTDFVRRYSYRKQGAARARVRYLDRLLRWFLEETSRTISCAHCQSLLDAERVLNPVDAYARVMDVDVLMRRLLVFVHSPWLQPDPVMQVTQWKFVEALIDAAQEGPLCPCAECTSAVANLRAHIDIKLHPNRR